MNQIPDVNIKRLYVAIFVFDVNQCTQLYIIISLVMMIIINLIYKDFK